MGEILGIVRMLEAYLDYAASKARFAVLSAPISLVCTDGFHRIFAKQIGMLVQHRDEGLFVVHLHRVGFPDEEEIALDAADLEDTAKLPGFAQFALCDASY